MRAELEAAYQPYLEGHGLDSLLIAPLLVNGQVIGTLGVSRDRGGQPYGEEDQAFLQSLADRAALAISNARLYDSVRAGRERLQALSRRLVEAQETERRYIARELHDEVGQLLTGLQLTQAMAARLCGEAAQANLAEAQNITREVTARVRDLSLTLRPAMLDDLGLLPTVLWHCERYTAQTHVQVDLKHTGVENRRFPGALETAAYRIMQEALTNAARHAGVIEVAVRVWADNERLGVQVQDHGAGFNPQAGLAAGSSGGLAGMRERADLLGGKFTIEAAAGQGTRVTAELPLRGPLERRIGRDILAGHGPEA
jgi:signal transduction histidine kinase